ncbi:hypothetical protein SAMN05442782_10766 [Streptomyces sp. OK228]|nr:hypothetical protein SAMN05442782_10766 [Streptomyces sp. OK228]
MTATSRNSAFYQQFLQLVEDANPVGDIYVITDNLSSHNSVSTRTWLEDHPRIQHVFIPVGERAGGASSARPPWPDAPSATATTSPTPPKWPRPSSTPAPDPGSGADPHRPPGVYAAAMCTSFEESSTSGRAISPRSKRARASCTWRRHSRPRHTRRVCARAEAASTAHGGSSRSVESSALSSPWAESDLVSTVRMIRCRFGRWPDPCFDWRCCLCVDLSATAWSGTRCRRAGDVSR